MSPHHTPKSPNVKAPNSLARIYAVLGSLEKKGKKKKMLMREKKGNKKNPFPHKFKERKEKKILLLWKQKKKEVML